MSANLENSAVATGLEKVSFHSNPKERKCQGILKLLHALEKETVTHSSVLAWRIPGTGEPGGLLSMGLHMPGQSQGWGSLVGCHLWGRTESDTTEAPSNYTDRPS